MGSYSFIDCEDIEVKDIEGLRGYIKRFKEAFKIPSDNKKYDIITEKDEVNFDSWNDTKLLSYWYSEDVYFLDGLYKYISGFVDFNFETSEYYAEIRFEESSTVFNLGHMEYADTSPDELINVKPTDKIKSFLMVENL